MRKDDMAHTKRKNLRRPQSKPHVKLGEGEDTLVSKSGKGWVTVGYPTFSFCCTDFGLAGKLVNLFVCRQTGDVIASPIKHKVAA